MIDRRKRSGAQSSDGLVPAAIAAQQVKIAVESSVPNAVEELQNLYRAFSAERTRVAEGGRAERAALRRALLDPNDHRPWLDVAAAREKQGALTGALEALSRARSLDDPMEATRRMSVDRVRLQLN